MPVVASCRGSISGRELSFVSDAAQLECAVIYHAAHFRVVAGMLVRAGAWRQWGSARPVQIQAVGLRSQVTGDFYLIPLVHGFELRLVCKLPLRDASCCCHGFVLADYNTVQGFF